MTNNGTALQMVMKKLNFRHAHSPVKLSEDSNIQAKYNVDI